MYTCLFEASIYGKTCYDPLMFHYPNDMNVYTDIEETFIVGDAIKVTPVLSAKAGMEYCEGSTEKKCVSSYFPEGTWVDLDHSENYFTSENKKYEFEPSDT
jgi:alpha-glucosidase (family GH31 glycosyl hydrolase)